MSIQIERLMKKYPQIFESVSYEGNGMDYWADVPLGDGTWLYMNPSWYCRRSDCGTIHEYTIENVLDAARYIYQNKVRWIDEHPEETENIQLVLSGAYDRGHKQ